MGRSIVHPAMLRIAFVIGVIALAAVLVATASARIGWRDNAKRIRALTPAFLCIHRYEGAWNADTGNGYYGGLQMDKTFMLTYGREFVRRWGWAHRWPPRVQILVAVRAHDSGRGFYPWPNTARRCGLI